MNTSSNQNEAVERTRSRDVEASMPVKTLGWAALAVTGISAAALGAIDMVDMTLGSTDGGVLSPVADMVLFFAGATAAVVGSDQVGRQLH